jgi:5'-nucleotidase
MRILLTNDDGIHAPGLRVLEEIARTLSDDVWVVAPENDQSGVSHAMSLNDPLRLRRLDDRHFAVNGTPTDSVLMGVHYVLKDQRPTLVLSGVNRGQNVAEDVTYSGTIAGAMEGTILGIPSIALSQAYSPEKGREHTPWNCARTHGAKIIQRLLAEGIPQNVLMNINFPDCEPEDVQGIAVSVQGKRDQEMISIEERFDGRNNPYYWVAFERNQSTRSTGTDLRALLDQKISITPLRLDLTDEPMVTRLAESFAAVQL